MLQFRMARDAAQSVGADVTFANVPVPPTESKAEVVATAKRDLRPGDQIDGIGGTTVYGVADSAAAVAAGQLLPLGLAARATVVRDVAVDEPLTYDDVELDDGSTILQLRRLQDQLLGDGTRRG